MLELRINPKGLDEPLKVLGRLEQNLHNLTPIKRKLGEIVREAIQGYIERGGTYEKQGGEIWPATDFKYAELEGKGHRRPLYWTGDLYHSIVDRLTAAGVAVGSPLPYAPWVMLAGQTAEYSQERSYSREVRAGNWVPRGAVIERSGGFAARGSGFRAYHTTYQRREVLRLFGEDVRELLLWMDAELFGGRASVSAA